MDGKSATETLKKSEEKPSVDKTKGETAKRSARERTKAFAEQHKRKIRWIIISIIIGIIIIAAILMYLKVNFIIGEEITIQTTPSYQSVQLRHTDTQRITITNTLDNYWLCNANCKYTFTDLSSNSVWLEEQITFKNHKSFAVQQDITATDLGYGQRMYRFEISCQNTKKNFCPSSEKPFKRDAIITLNYEPTDTEKTTMKETQESYATIIQDIQIMDKQLFIMHNLAQELTNIQWNTTALLSQDKTRSRIDNNDILFTQFIGQVKHVHTLWDARQYPDAKKTMQEGLLLDKSAILRENIANTKQEMQRTIMIHNQITNQFQLLDSEQESLMGIATYDTQQSSFIQELLENISLRAFFFTSKKFDDYDVLFNTNTQDSVTINTLKNNFAADNQTSIVSEYLANTLYCIANQTIIQEENIDQTRCNSTNISKYYLTQYNTTMNHRTQYLQESIQNSIPNLTTIEKNYVFKQILDDANRTCNDAKIILNQIQQLHQTQEQEDRLINANTVSNTTIKEDIQREEHLITLSLLIQFEEQAPLTLKKTIEEYKTIIIRSLVAQGWTDFDETRMRNYYPTQHNSTRAKNIPLQQEVMLKTLEKISTCHNPNIEQYTNIATQNNISTTLVEEILQANHYPERNDTALEITAQCCYKNECNDCKSEHKTPLIVLHGHSFNIHNSAYNSPEIFDNLEQVFSDNNTYITVGNLDNQDYRIPAGDLGKNSIPIIVKPTYYLSTYSTLFNTSIAVNIAESKTGNIDTYALRLKEIIDYTTYITGKPTVNIVAHSMGGLVVRRYMQIFGAEKINTVIFVGTPNNGISDTIYSYCKFFGEINECNDMHAGSTFMQKLNQPGFTQTPKKTILIIGRGCDTDDEDGDGVASIESAKAISWNATTYYINGTCTTTEKLHNELVDPIKHPEITNIILENLD